MIAPRCMQPLTYPRPPGRLSRSVSLAVLPLAAMVFVLSACGSQPESSPEPEDPTTSSEAALAYDLGSAMGAPTLSSNTCGATNQMTPSCAYSTAPDHAYFWTAPFTGNFTFTTSGASFDTILHIYNRGTGAAMGCNDDSNGTLQSSLSFAVNAGQQLSIVVDGYGGACGNFPLNITGTPIGPVKKAMTWALLGSVAPPGSGHAYALPGSDGFTNSYQGDTYTNQSLPVLCISKNGIPHPGTSVIGPPYETPGGAWRRTWSSSTLALSPPIAGTSLTSRTTANAFCASMFGSGYRMAEFHDGDAYLWSGWDLWGEARGNNLAPFYGTRFWVAINDQNTNPW
jgi:hypothetical protein